MAATPQPENIEIFADLSDTTRKCERCWEVFPSAHLTLVYDRTKRRPPKSHCKKCLEHSLQKPGTIVTTSRTTGNAKSASDLGGRDVSLQPSGQRFANYKQTQANAQVNAAHRGATSVAVVPFGNATGSASQLPVAPPNPGRGPNIALPGQAAYMSQAVGYTDQHAYFMQDLKRGQTKAKVKAGLDSANTVSFRVDMVYYPPGKNRPKNLGKCSVGMTRIALHIGAEELLKVVCDEFDKPGEKSFLDNFHSLLDRSRVFLEDKQHGSKVRSAFADRDQDAISHYYRSNTKDAKDIKYNVNKTGLILYLVVTEDYHDDIMDRMEAVFTDVRSEKRSSVTTRSRQNDGFASAHSEIVNTMTSGNADKSSQLTGPLSGMALSSAFDANIPTSGVSQLKRSYISERTAENQDSHPDSPEKPPRKTTRFDADHESALSSLDFALARQAQALTSKDVNSAVYNVKYHNTTFYFPRVFSDLEGLYLAPQLKPNLCKSEEATLFVDFQHKIANEGAFKMPYLGHISVPHGANNDTIGPFELGKPICAKRFFLRSQTGKITYQTGLADSVNVFKEMNIFEWAVTLFNDSYNWIKLYDLGHGEPPFNIPRMRFVYSSAAVTSAANGNRSFFIEELIDSDKEGPFIKYINNASGEILTAATITDEHYDIAKFLAFVQHLQYQQSGQRVFISDLQGGKTLLTDPQIITHPRFGNNLFGDGNVRRGFSAFHKTHCCNEFCKHYDLSAPLPPAMASGMADSEPAAPHVSRSVASTIPGLDYINNRRGNC